MRGRHVGLDVARCDRVDAHTAAGELVRECLGQLGDAALRRRVRREVEAAREREHRREQDDRAAALVDHLPRRGLREHEDGGEVEVDDPLPLLQRQLERSDPRDVVPALATSASMRSSRSTAACACSEVGEVDARRTLRSLHRPAVGPQPLRRRRSDPAARAGDERDLVVTSPQGRISARRGASPAGRRARGRDRGRARGRAARVPAPR